MKNRLFDAARDAMAKAHVPYSEFPVGAALCTSDGAVYAGCNIENASYPEGWCAETTAIAHMVMGGDTKISEILVMAEKKDAATPCGGCRQRIAEFADDETVVHLCDGNGVVKTLPFTDLLPASFDLENLK